MAGASGNSREQLKALLEKHYRTSDQRRAVRGFPRYGICIVNLPAPERQEIFTNLHDWHEKALARHTRRDQDRMTAHSDWYGTSDLFIPIHTIDWLNEEEAGGILSVLERLQQRQTEMKSRCQGLEGVICPPKAYWSTRLSRDEGGLLYHMMLVKRKGGWFKREPEDPAATLNRILGHEFFTFSSQSPRVGHIAVAEGDIPALMRRLEEPEIAQQAQQAVLDYSGIEGIESRGTTPRRNTWRRG